MYEEVVVIGIYPETVHVLDQVGLESFRKGLVVLSELVDIFAWGLFADTVFI